MRVNAGRSETRRRRAQVSLGRSCVGDRNAVGGIACAGRSAGKLAAQDPRKSQIVELRYFGGLTVRRDSCIPETVSPDGGARVEDGQGLALPCAERGRNLMKPERWQQVNDLFQSTVERAPEERTAFLEEACRGDEGLRREVEVFDRL